LLYFKRFGVIGGVELFFTSKLSEKSNLCGGYFLKIFKKYYFEMKFKLNKRGKYTL
jgi:hypothetical protein